MENDNSLKGESRVNWMKCSEVLVILGSDKIILIYTRF